MLVIRDEQLQVFRRDAILKFIDQMASYIASEHPEKYQRMHETGTRAFIRRGMERAAARGLRSQGAVAGLLDLMLKFGEDFELAPDRIWAIHTLAHSAIPDYIKVEAVRERFESQTQGRVIRPFEPEAADQDSQ
jgi:hypothetical protein